jgi:hypothetical protein
MTGRSGSAMLPATFEERGAVVPFTTPALSLARVRRDQRQRMILMMPNFGGTEGAFVVPWNGVAEVATMSIHDRALHEEVEAAEAVTPEQLRGCALRIGMTGLAGPVVAEAARAAIDAEKRKTVELHFLLIVSLLNALGLEADDLMALGPGTEAWRNRTKTLLGQAGQRLRIEVSDIYSRIAALSRVLVPLGLAAGRQEGRLRSVLDGFAEFSDGITEWSEAEKSELAPFAEFAGFVAHDTLRNADRLFRQLDTGVRDIVSVVRDWNNHAKAVVGTANKLSWLLDGWDVIFAFWEQAQSQPIEIQREIVGQIVRVLPLVPRNESEGPQEELELRQQQLQGRQLQSTADWRRGRADLELMARLEAIKARVLMPAVAPLPEAAS